MLYIGWDISTSVIGVTVLGSDGQLVQSTYHDLRKVDPDMLEKAASAHEFVRSLNGSYLAFTRHFVEDRLSSFAAGRTMQQTLLKLAAFNAVVSYLIHDEFGAPVSHVHPSRVKSLLRKEGLVIPKGADKKKVTLEYVQSRESSFKVDLNRNGKPQPYCYDMADSYIVARAGFLCR